jgi:DNA-directed RNA polymerase specialized sigma24 family protein
MVLMRANRDKRELVTRNQQMLAMQRAGKTLREIATVFGVSEVRVHVIVHREQARQEREISHKYLIA